MLPLVGHTRPVRAVAFAPDGLALVSGADDGRVIVWDRLGGVARHTLSVGFPGVKAVACHPDNDRFCAAWRYTSIGARATRDRERVRFWHLASGKVAVDVDPADAPVAAAWHRVAGADPQEVPAANCEAVSHLHFSPDGARLYVLDLCVRGDGAAHGKWVCEYATDPPRDKPRDGWVGRRRGVEAFVLSLDGRVAAVASAAWVRAGAVDAATVPPGYAARGAVRSLALTPDGGLLAGCWESAVTVWGTAGGGEVREFRGHAAPVEAVAAHPTEPVIASAGQDGTVVLWEPVSGATRGRYDWGLGPVHALAFAPDGLTLAVAGDGGLVCFDLG